MARRSRAREVALQLLFQHDVNPKPVPRPAVEKFARDRLRGHADLAAFALALFDGVLANRPAIDAVITKTAQNWRLTRINPADRNVLRLGVYELAFAPDPDPTAVALNEAIELARRYGGADSPAFVNGILDAAAKAEAKTPPPGPLPEAERGGRIPSPQPPHRSGQGEESQDPPRAGEGGERREPGGVP